MNTIVTSTLRLLPLTFLFWWPSALAAQGGLTLSGAIASWDLAGTGTGTTVAIRWDHRLADLSAPGPLSLRPEIRVRAVDPWVGTVADFALGVRRGRR